MNIAIIDADLIGRKNHKFPNLACEKISAYWKEKGAKVILKTDYDNLDVYDHVYISKVFTDTIIPDYIKESEKIHLGGTGFYFDKAPNLPYDIEHHMPDYHLYDEWIEKKIKEEKEKCKTKNKEFKEKNYRNKFKEYTDYSIGFITRGCFRKCGFCVNQKYDKVFKHSNLEEFYDPNRSKICFLDDNFLGYSNWKEIIKEIKDTNKRIKFKQGLDERLLTEEKCEEIFSLKYDGDFTFAFDDIDDYKLIEEKLKLIRKYTSSKMIKFYILVGYKSTDLKDIEDAFKRIELIMKYKCLPFIMRYKSKDSEPYKNSEFKGMYIAMARWCNQQNMFKTKSFREYCYTSQKDMKNQNNLCAAMRSMLNFEKKYPDIAKKYFDIKWSDYSLDKNHFNITKERTES